MNWLSARAGVTHKRATKTLTNNIRRFIVLRFFSSGDCFLWPSAVSFPFLGSISPI
jgi:hypothetical protein